MKFVRFGSQIVNMDLVTNIEIEHKRAVLFFAVASDNGYDTQTRDAVELSGNVAVTALERWLVTHSEDACVPFLSEDK